MAAFSLLKSLASTIDISIPIFAAATFEKYLLVPVSTKKKSDKIFGIKKLCIIEVGSTLDLEVKISTWPLSVLVFRHKFVVCLYKLFNSCDLWCWCCLLWRQTKWPKNQGVILALSLSIMEYRNLKILQIVCVLSNNYFSQSKANDLSAPHCQISRICSTLSNNY